MKCLINIDAWCRHEYTRRRSPLLYLLIRKVITPSDSPQTPLISTIYRLHTTFILKVKSICRRNYWKKISVYFKALDQLLIIYSAFVKTFEKNVNTYLQKACH